MAVNDKNDNNGKARAPRNHVLACHVAHRDQLAPWRMLDYSTAYSPCPSKAAALLYWPWHAHIVQQRLFHVLARHVAQGDQLAPWRMLDYSTAYRALARQQHCCIATATWPCHAHIVQQRLFHCD